MSNDFYKQRSIGQGMCTFGRISKVQFCSKLAPQLVQTLVARDGLVAPDNRVGWAVQMASKLYDELAKLETK